MGNDPAPLCRFAPAKARPLTSLSSTVPGVVQTPEARKFLIGVHHHPDQRPSKK
jgi:hypothetical protein